MIKINFKSRDFTEVEQYLMTSSSDMQAMKNVADGTEITVAGILEFTDCGDDGDKSADIMSIIDPDLRVFAFQSATLKRTIKQLHAIYKDTPFTIIKITGKSKAGREYINAKLKLNIEGEIAKAKALALKERTK